MVPRPARRVTSAARCGKTLLVAGSIAQKPRRNTIRADLVQRVLADSADGGVDLAGWPGAVPATLPVQNSSGSRFAAQCAVVQCY